MFHPLRIAFVDISQIQYDPETPYHTPLGGSQSALCYLAEHLARLGHSVWLINRLVSPPGRYRGVECVGLSTPDSLLQSLDVVIALNDPISARTLRTRTRAETRMISWSQHAHTEAQFRTFLLDPQNRDAWDAFALVSDWQSRQYQDLFAIPEQKIAIMRNAISPHFEGLFSPGQSILAQKSQDPLMAYTSTPFRGLDIILNIFPGLRPLFPESRLAVYSSLKVYQMTEEETMFRDLYARCQREEGVEYYGSVDQKQLAQALKPVLVLSYPNTFAETSCISVMEAMAAGCLVVTSELGALPETTGGFGWLVPPNADRQAYTRQFAEVLLSVIYATRALPQAIEERLQRQVQWVHDQATWLKRAETWSLWLAELCGKGLEPPVVLTKGENDMKGRESSIDTPRPETPALNPEEQLTYAYLAFQRDENTKAFDLLQPVMPFLHERPDAWTLFGILSRRLGHLEEAKLAYFCSIIVYPEYLGVYQNVVNLIRTDKKMRERAYQLCQWGRTFSPQEASLCHLTGQLYLEDNAPEKALTFCQLAVALLPEFANYYVELGNAYKGMKLPDQAMDCYRRVTNLNPTSSTAHHNLGITLRDQGYPQEAELHYRCSVVLDPTFSAAQCALGSILTLQGQPQEAVRMHQYALYVEPDYAGGWVMLANAHETMEEMAKAETHYHWALALKPEYAEGYNNLGNLVKGQSRMEESILCYQRAVCLSPSFTGAHSNYAFSLNYLHDITPERFFEEHRQFGIRHTDPITPVNPIFPNDLNLDRRLRIGYVSPDFCHHVVSCYFEPVMACHDHQKFEIFGYAELARPDVVTHRLVSYADHWHYTNNMTDQRLSDQIRKDRIDILVDLAGHTANNRLLAFASKPAPIQVTYLGYSATTGMKAIDYLLADHWVLPPGPHERFFTEEIWRLPEVYRCFQFPEASPAVAPLPVQRKGYVTLGSFNNFCKVTPKVVALWAGILKALPTAKIVVVADEESVYRVFEPYGIECHRVMPAPRLPFYQFMEWASQEVDIALDPFPHTGPTTAYHTMWMGIPVVTLVAPPGPSLAVRFGLGVLGPLGLKELIAYDEGEYAEKVIALANHHSRLGELRMGLRPHLANARMIQGNDFTRQLEAAYQAMWQRYVTSRPTT